MTVQHFLKFKTVLVFSFAQADFFDTSSSQESGNNVMKLRRYLNVYSTEHVHHQNMLK